MIPKFRYLATIFAVTSLVVLTLAAEHPSAPQVTVTYLANEGVMINCSGQKVVIDALFRDSLENYMRHSPEQQERIETGKAPFDGTRLALTSGRGCNFGRLYLLSRQSSERIPRYPEIGLVTLAQQPVALR